MRSAERLIFIPFIGALGGVERLALALCSYLRQYSVPHRVLCFRDDVGLADCAGGSLVVERIVVARHAAAEAWALRRAIERCAPTHKVLAFELKGGFYAGLSGCDFDVHLDDPPSLLGADITKDAPSMRRVAAEPPRFGWRRLPYFARAEAAQQITRFALRRAATVVVTTNVIAREVRDRYQIRATVVRPGVRVVSEVTAAPSPPHPGEPLRLLSVCRLEPSKRVAWMIQALADRNSSAAERRNWVLDVVGEGSEAGALRRLAIDSGVDDRVRFHGRLPDAALERAFSSADVFLMPAIQGFGLPALESLARGIPVVLHRQSGASEILSGTPWVEILEEDDGSDLAPAIERIETRIRARELRLEARPAIPTDQEWAAETCAFTQWLSPARESAR